MLSHDDSPVGAFPRERALAGWSPSSRRENVCGNTALLVCFQLRFISPDKDLTKRLHFKDFFEDYDSNLLRGNDDIFMQGSESQWGCSKADPLLLKGRSAIAFYGFLEARADLLLLSFLWDKLHLSSSLTFKRLICLNFLPLSKVLSSMKDDFMYAWWFECLPGWIKDCEEICRVSDMQDCVWHSSRAWFRGNCITPPHCVFFGQKNEEERQLHFGGDFFVVSSPNEQSNDPALVVYQTVTFKKYTHPIYSDI